MSFWVSRDAYLVYKQNYWRIRPWNQPNSNHPNRCIHYERSCQRGNQEEKSAQKASAKPRLKLNRAILPIFQVILQLPTPYPPPTNNNEQLHFTSNKSIFHTYFVVYRHICNLPSLFGNNYRVPN